LEILESRGKTVARYSGLFGVICLVTFALMTIADVFMRWLFNKPINGVADIGPLIMAIAVSAIFPVALAGRYHITVGFLGEVLGSRMRRWLDALAAFVTTIFFALFAWQLVLYTIDLHEIGQTTWVIRLPVAPWWAVTCFFVVLCVFIQLVVFAAQLAEAVGARAPTNGRHGWNETPVDGE